MMSEWQKILIGIAAGLVIGLGAGFWLGARGKGALVTRAETSEKELAAVRLRVAQGQSTSAQAEQRTRLAFALLRAKEQILRAAVQLNANNFGIASQRLGAANVLLRKAHPDADAATKKSIDLINEELSNAHSLSMKLDPTVKVNLERIVDLLQRIPAAR